MLQIQITNQFKKDLKKFNRNQVVIKELDSVVKKLLNEKALEPKYCDHPLVGQWKSSRDCHIRPNVLLIYRIEKKMKLLILERLGSHAELFK
jgi:mRNA interferase YafQ